MNYGKGQKVNPHALRGRIINDTNTSNSFINDDNSIDIESKLYLKNKFLGLSFNSGLLERKIKLEKLLGKNNYKKIVNKVKKISR